MRPWLWIPPQWAHDISPWALKIFELHSQLIPQWRPFTWRGLYFSNRLGIAGGVDKNAVNVRAWWNLGCGFVEVGTITPFPQNKNPGITVMRNSQHWALWNKLGFPNHGGVRAFENLKRLPQPHLAPVLANIGKNRATPLATAALDYCALVKKLNLWVDGFVINISSPNTQGLRQLLEPTNLTGFLRPIIKTRDYLTAIGQPHRPMLLKISPDLTDS